MTSISQKINLVNVTTKRQEKNGTIAFMFGGAKYLSYNTGYIRIEKLNGDGNRIIYQLNKKIDGSHKRSLISNEADRIKEIINIAEGHALKNN